MLKKGFFCKITGLQSFKNALKTIYTCKYFTKPFQADRSLKPEVLTQLFLSNTVNKLRQGSVHQLAS